MKSNATINTRLEALLNVLDARSDVVIFKMINESKDSKDTYLTTDKIYNLISDPEFIGKYGNYKVIGLTVVTSLTGLLIEEG